MAPGKDGLVNSLSKHNIATLWHYGGNTQWVSTPVVYLGN